MLLNTALQADTSTFTPAPGVFVQRCLLQMPEELSSHNWSRQQVNSSSERERKTNTGVELQLESDQMTVCCTMKRLTKDFPQKANMFTQYLTQYLHFKS